MPSRAGLSRREVHVPAQPVVLPGYLDVPESVCGVVVFAHGSGSSRHSTRNQFVASVLVQAGLATLLLDLLTEAEAEDRRNVFDLELLSARLLAAARWAITLPELERVPVGLFGASTGAGAALIAAAEEPKEIRAVVSRGGRPDLAEPLLPRVAAPTLLIVGGNDPAVLELNEEALSALACEKRLAVVDRATHLFEEPGTLEEAARLAAEWFTAHLRGGPR